MPKYAFLFLIMTIPTPAIGVFEYLKQLVSQYGTLNDSNLMITEILQNFKLKGYKVIQNKEYEAKIILNTGDLILIESEMELKITKFSCQKSVIYQKNKDSIYLITWQHVGKPRVAESSKDLYHEINKLIEFK